MAKAVTGASSSICAEPHADLCPETGFNAGHRCERPAQHDDGIRHPYHECACEQRWMGGPTLPEIERATVVEVRPGDVLLFEVAASLTDQEVERFRSEVREQLPADVRIAVLEHARFGGVIRHEKATRHGGRLCGFPWRDEHNPTGSDHRCSEPLHVGLSEEHQCGCGATRQAMLNDALPHMAETTSLSDLARGKRTYLPTNRQASGQPVEEDR